MRELRLMHVRLHRPLLPSYHIRQKYPWTKRITVLRTLLVALLLLLSWVYLQLVVRYGSISPVATLMFTRPYHGRSDTDFPPKTTPPWRPKFRVVVSMTTTPNRLDKVMDSVRSLTKQSLVPDQIYVNIPKGPMKRHPERSYDDVVMPSELENLAPLVKINRCVDDGPATKLLGALRLEHDPSTLIITVDDDFEYPKQLVEALTWEAESTKDDVLGICGWGMLPIWHKVGVVPAYVPYFMRPRGRFVDILQACCGNAYRRGFFHDIEAFAEIPAVCVTVDDVWIAGYLRTVEHRRSAIISKRLDPEDPPWKIAEAKSEAKKMTLSNYNHEKQIHYKCVQAIENKFKTRWTRNFEDASH
uniref:Glycosyltransferase 2-like domain-containing protein n=1 Tax=Globisporangium ultimum (strain ATCC 200006 / CBS 805.95 / DAOM BR144) TaxID=431595 RepID=K3XB56_GLOUD